MKYNFQDVDQRIINTKITLSGAIFEIIKRCQKIKVLDICKEANITPMTYYHHFHNKQQLLEYAIKEQLSGILPIPQKLKPINLKHFVYYLTFSLNKFVTNNYDLIYSAIKQAKENKYLGSYIDLISQIIKDLVKQEIKLLVKDNIIQIEFCANIICGSMKQLFTQMVMNQRHISSDLIWMWFKNIFICLK